ncbi:MAG: SDR family NAD(P)-dependent oxidoreductase [Armatimonadetes bacterium]|nr:SDR family NAD(P)-dependent oxidoreductase [Armatimonadota bacterium]
MATAMVTGAAGFIGSHVADALAAAGWEVVGVDNFDPYYPRELKEANLKEVSPAVRDGFIEADIRDAQAMESIIGERKVEVIVHLAAKAGVRPSIAAPAEYMDVNIGGTVALLEAARKAGVREVIFASSSSVYGRENQVPFRETQPVQSPMSPYAASKIAGEALCYTYHHLYNIHITCLRLFTVYGPRQRPDLAINKFVRLMFAGEPIPVFGDGTTSRDYTYVGDIVRGILAAIDRNLEYAVINLGNSRPVKLMELIEALERVTGVEAKIEHLPPQPGDMPHTYADITRARELLNWQPEVSLDEGLAEFVRWWRNRQV